MPFQRNIYNISKILAEGNEIDVEVIDFKLDICDSLVVSHVDHAVTQYFLLFTHATSHQRTTSRRSHLRSFAFIVKVRF